MNKNGDVAFSLGCIVCKRPMARTVRVDLENIAVCESEKCAQRIQAMQPPRSDQRAH